MGPRRARGALVVAVAVASVVGASASAAAPGGRRRGGRAAREEGRRGGREGRGAVARAGRHGPDRAVEPVGDVLPLPRPRRGRRGRVAGVRAGAVGHRRWRWWGLGVWEGIGDAFGKEILGIEADWTVVGWTWIGRCGFPFFFSFPFSVQFR